MSTAIAGPLPARSYTLGQIVLHWAIAVLVIWQLVFGESMQALERPAGADATDLFLANTHIWAGIAILALVALRIVLRLIHGAPPGDEFRQADRVARQGHPPGVLRAPGGDAGDRAPRLLWRPADGRDPRIGQAALHCADRAPCRGDAVAPVRAPRRNAQADGAAGALNGAPYNTPAPWLACQTSQAPSQIILTAT